MTDYIIIDDLTSDENGCTEADYADESVVRLCNVTARGRKLLASGVDARRVVELRGAELSDHA